MPTYQNTGTSQLRFDDGQVFKPGESTVVKRYYSHPLLVMTSEDPKQIPIKMLYEGTLPSGDLIIDAEYEELLIVNRSDGPITVATNDNTEHFIIPIGLSFQFMMERQWYKVSITGTTGSIGVYLIA
jgi:hypothetical protein